MSNGERGPYSAAPSSLGYFYQCRYALLEALHRLSCGDCFYISIETLDDVVFEDDCGTVEILQTKHHINASTHLTDASPDLWKTLRIWVEGLTSGTIPADTCFVLITTSECSEGMASYYLRPQTRNEQKALEKLKATAMTSTNQTNSDGYQVFLGLDEESKNRFLESITILDSAPQIDDLDISLHQALFHAVDRRFLDHFLQRLEGWWYDRVIKHLKQENVQPIISGELEAEEASLRAQFKEDNLPIDDDIMRTGIDSTGYFDHTFVKQLRLIGIGETRIFHAIRNYFRAFEHRSRWMREDLIYVGELDCYEERLVEEWDLLFQQMCDDLGQSAAEENKKIAAQNLYRWVESGAHHFIRPAVIEPAISRGTYQILADDSRVGWHIEFRQRLKELLERKEVSL